MLPSTAAAICWLTCGCVSREAPGAAVEGPLSPDQRGFVPQHGRPAGRPPATVYQFRDPGGRFRRACHAGAGAARRGGAPLPPPPVLPDMPEPDSQIPGHSQGLRDVRYRIRGQTSRNNPLRPKHLKVRLRHSGQRRRGNGRGQPDAQSLSPGLPPAARAQD